MNYQTVLHDELFSPPTILLRDDNFLSESQILQYQNLLHTSSWTPAPSLQKIQYFSQDLYKHYRWNNDWSNVGWRDDAPVQWEELYNRIAQYLPAHRVHWVDAKITPPFSTGTERHRDKDPWIPGGSKEFDKALTILLNLNTKWEDSWGGDFVLWSAKMDQNQKIELVEFEKVPIKPGQLLIVENCWHSIAPITQIDCSRISFILHVLKYKQV